MEIEFSAKESANVNRRRRQWNIRDVYLLFREEVDLGDSGTMVFRSFDRD